MKMFWMNKWRRLEQRYMCVVRSVPDRVWLTWVAVRLIWGRAYRGAEVAVVKAANDPSFTNLTNLKGVVEDRATLYPQWAENWLRSLEAEEWAGLWMREYKHNVPTWRRDLMVNLAYVAYREHGYVKVRKHG